MIQELTRQGLDGQRRHNQPQTSALGRRLVDRRSSEGHCGLSKRELPVELDQTMPTKPVIPTSIDNPEVAATLGRFADLIDEAVNFGTHVMEWHLKSATGGDRTLPITMSLRHGIELLDSVAVSIRSSCVDPCKLLLRGLLETLFSTAYILESDTTRRAMAFMTTYVNQNLKTYRKFQLTSDQGRQFQELINKDRLASNMEMKLPPSIVDASIANLEQLLSRPEYHEANAHYLKLRKGRTTNPPWYSFYGGPKNLEQLADHLKLPAIYDILYRQWSGAAHGTDIIQGNISSSSSGHASIHQIRLPSNAQTLTLIAVSLALELFRAVIKQCVPDKIVDYQSWYANEIRPVYMQLTGDKIINVELSHSSDKPTPAGS